MVLDYLDFDHSDNGDDTASWDAMACVVPARLSAAFREVELVLAWAHVALGAAGEWCEWDYDLQCQQEGAGDLYATFDGDSGVLHCQTPDQHGGRCTLTLTLSGTPAFREALRERFSVG